MQPFTASQNFYDAAEIEFGKYHQVVIEFPNQTFIPNILKTNTRPRRFQIMRIPARTKFVINRLRNVNEEVIMHVICGQPNVEIEDRETKGIFIQRLRERNSHIIRSEALNKNKYTIIPPYTDTLVTFEVLKIEVQENVKVEDHSKVEAQTPNSLGPIYEFCPNTKDIRRHQSFLRRTITLKEVRERLLFIDAEFARTVENKSVPVSVVILDYNGKRLLDSVCCPREKIRNYETKYHGFKEKDLIGREDSEDVIRKIAQIVDDRIIVGADLHMDLVALKINTNRLLGIRDLSNALCIRNRMNYQEGQAMGLKKMALVVLGKRVQEGFHSASEDAETVRKIYLQVEHEWIDHDGCSSSSQSEQENSFEEPMEIEDDFSIYAPDDEFPSIAIDSEDDEFDGGEDTCSLVRHEEIKQEEIQDKQRNEKEEPEPEEEFIVLRSKQIIKFVGRIIIENTMDGGIIRLLD